MEVFHNLIFGFSVALSLQNLFTASSAAWSAR